VWQNVCFVQSMACPFMCMPAAFLHVAASCRMPNLQLPTKAMSLGFVTIEHVKGVVRCVQGSTASWGVIAHC
jgi:hypothetical protein